MPSGIRHHGRLPVFVLPNTVTFYLEDKSTHKQVVTLYNTDELPIRFRVLCTSPQKYTVTDPDGHVDPGKMIDIVIRHSDVSPANCNVKDKFRFQVFDHITKEVIGFRDVIVSLVSGYPPERSTPEKDRFECLPPGQGPKQTQYNIIDKESLPAKGSNPNFAVVLTGITCIIALLLPDETEQNSSIPVKLSFNLKLIFAYVLGLVTMAILKP